MAGIRAGIDIGGAFTDLVAVGSDGEVKWVKVDSTPDLLTGVINAFRVSGIDLANVTDIVHGHTVVINALTTGNMSKVGLITTKGFKDILEIQRTNRKDMYNLRYHKPKPLVPRYLRTEIDERIDSKGSVIRPISHDSFDGIARLFKENNVESVAVSLINSYTNKSHEAEAGRHIKNKGLKYVTLSHEIGQIWKEYERTSTAVLNSAVLPIIDKYVSKLEGFLKASGFKGNFYIITSNGGHVTSSFTKRYPIFTLESGPIAGVIGAIKVAQEATNSKHISIITLDGGSVTTKSSLVQGGTPRIVTDYNVGETDYYPGYPASIPIMDIIEVGIGGTSIVNLKDGRLSVGPKAAGSYPGPACYGRGGEDPTLTDAYVINGFIDPQSFLGGKITLDKELASKAIRKIAKRLNLTINDAADGIIRLANESAAQAIRLVSIQRGYDPRDFNLVAFGGSGPMFAPFIAQELQIPIIIPAVPLGDFSAWGMLNSGVRHDLVKTVMINLTPGSWKTIESEFRALESELKRIFKQERKEEYAFARFADMRYVGQGHTLRVELPPELIENDTESIVQMFHKKHEQEYLFRMDSPAEIVNIHLVGYLSPTETRQSVFENGDGRAKSKTKMYVRGGWKEAAVYSRKDLKVGQRINGMAIVEEETSTVILLEDQVAYVNPSGNIMINKVSK